MNRASLLSFTAAIALGAACGGTVISQQSGSASGAGGASTSDASATSTTSTGGASMCNLPPPPSPTVPTTPGCYENKMMAGWVAVPCSCELWMANATHAPMGTGVHLAVSPPELVPALNGPLVVEVDFDDADGAWFAAWSNEPGNGVAFSLAHANATTTVRMGQSDVKLLSVPVAACATRKARARIQGNPQPSLSLEAVFDDGAPSVQNMCSNPPPTPPNGP